MSGPIRRLFEAQLIARELNRSIAFYRNVLELALALGIPERNVASFWVPTSDRPMLPRWFFGASPLCMRLDLRDREGIRWNSTPCCRTGHGRNPRARHGRSGGG